MLNDVSFPSGAASTDNSEITAVTGASCLDTISDDPTRGGESLIKTTLVESVSQNVYGRSAEALQLVGAYEQVRDDNTNTNNDDGNTNNNNHSKKSPRPLTILVHGSAGIGKTCLVESLRGPVSKDGALYVTGKFDQAPGQLDPYPALVAAFDEICDLAIQSEHVHQIKKKLMESLGEEVKILARLVSGVSRIVDSNSSMEDHDFATSQGQSGNEFAVGHAFIRFKQQCRHFLKSVSSKSQPIVLFLDDLQFADKESIEIIESLIESDIGQVLIIASYRDDQQVGPHIDLVKKLSSSPHSERVIGIPLTNFSCESVNSFLSGILELDPNETRSLSEICQRKTLGNPFYVTQYLRLLEDKGLVRFSEARQRWVWDVSTLQAETNVTGNILDVINERAKKAGEEVRELMKLASCLGFSFDSKVLLVIAKAGVHRESLSEEMVFSVLGNAEKEGFIEKVVDDVYKWAHDKIMQSFSEMFSEAERERVHYRIGQSLVQSNLPLSDSERFLVVDQLNMGASYVAEDEQGCHDLAERNVEAGDKSFVKSAFASGHQYYENAIDLLPDDTWSRQYRWTLDIYSKAATAALNSGNTSKTQKWIEVIFRNGETLKDKFQATCVHIRVLGSQGRGREAIGAGRTVLRQLGVKIPARPKLLHIIYEFVMAKCDLRKKTDEDLLSLPKANEKTIMAMQIMSMIHHSAYFDDHEVLAIVCLRAMRLSIRRGLCKLSPMGFAMYGAIQCAAGSYDEAYRIGMLSLRMMEVLDARKEVLPRLYLYVYPSIYHIRKPVIDMKDIFLEGYAVAMEAGDVCAAVTAGIDAGHVMKCCGLPLETTVAQLMFCYDLIIEFNELSVLSVSAPIIQVCLNLMGESDDPVVLTGAVMNQGEALRHNAECNNDLGLYITWFCCFEAAFWFGAWFIAAQYLELVLANPGTGSKLDAHYATAFSRNYLLLTHLTLYRLSGEKKYIVRFRKLKRFLEKREKKGILPSAKPLLKLAAAEEMSDTNNSQVAVQAAYDDAIALFAETGYVHLEGLANERAGDAILRQFSDSNTALVYFSVAEDKYRAWQAWAKVDHIQSKCERQEGTIPPQLITQTLAEEDVQ